MRPILEIKQNARIKIRDLGADGGWGIVYLPKASKPAVVVFSWGGGWDHVSVSYDTRCCTWEEMCTIKNIFFKDDECVVQYHPAKEDYINCHPHCLHLWRPQHESIPMPPKYMVGVS